MGWAGMRRQCVVHVAVKRSRASCALAPVQPWSNTLMPHPSSGVRANARLLLYTATCSTHRCHIPNPTHALRASCCPESFGFCHLCCTAILCLLPAARCPSRWSGRLRSQALSQQQQPSKLARQLLRQQPGNSGAGTAHTATAAGGAAGGTCGCLGAGLASRCLLLLQLL